MGRWYLAIVVLCVTLNIMVGERAFGQVPLASTKIFQGVAFPENVAEGNWFFNDVTKKVYVFKEMEWNNVVSGECKSAEACRGYVFVETDGDYKVFYGNGSALGMDCKGYFCSDSLVGWWNEHVVLFQNARDSILAVMTNLITPCDLNVHQSQLKGETVFCIPQYFDESLQFSCDELHTWGMLGEKGKWVIPAQFDEPFSFVDGIAAVKYKGRDRRINEKGEFVE
jgi:hypothetical protein